MGLLDEFYPPDYSKLKRGQFRRDTPKMRESAANVPVDVARGTLAGLLGLTSDTLNFAPAYSPMPMEQFGDYNYAPSQKIPYGSEYFLENLPLAPAADNPLGKVAGQLGSFAPMVPVKAARMAGKGVAATAKFVAPKAGQLAEDYMRSMGMMPGIVPNEGGLLTPTVKPSLVPAEGGLLTPSVKPQAPVSDLGFYSAAEQAALNLQRNKGTGQSFINDLMKAPDVKKEELAWTGLDEFLANKPNVTKQEVQDFIQSNRVNVQERQLGGAITEDPVGIAKRKEIFDKYEPQIQALYKDMDSFGYDTPREVLQSTDNRLRKLQEMRDAEADAFYKIPEPTPTKYDKYQLPGGDNYREILLTTPVRGKSELDAAEIAAGDLSRQTADLMEQWVAASELNPGDPSVVALYQRVADSRRLRDQAKTKAQELKNQIGSQTYQSSHFNEPNVLAHMRVNDRIDADGKKMLLIEEVQSDWHQAGREKGYKTKARKVTEEQKQEFKKLNAIDPNDRTGPMNERLDELDSLIAGESQGVPDAPFKDTWHQLALKRAIKEAVDKGYDRIGLTTGKQQIDRFSDELRQNVDQIDFSAGYPNQGTTTISATKNGQLTFEGNVVDGKFIDGAAKGKSIDEVLGKSIAQKILSHDQSQGLGTIKGDDLTIGGEGMKKYYDEVYPAFLEKQGKKYGAKVGETEIKTGQRVQLFGVGKLKTGNEKVRYLDITPEMRKAVKEGQPMFAAAPIAGVGLGVGQQQPTDKLANGLASPTDEEKLRRRQSGLLYAP